MTIEGLTTSNIPNPFMYCLRGCMGRKNRRGSAIKYTTTCSFPRKNVILGQNDFIHYFATGFAIYNYFTDNILRFVH